MVAAAAGQTVEVVVESAVAASVVEADCTQDVVSVMAVPSSVVAAAADIVEVGVAVVDTSAPSHHARLYHSDRGQCLQYSGSEYAQALGLPAQAAE